MKCLLIAFLLLCPCSLAFGQDQPDAKPAETDSHTAAVEEFFVVMKMKETTDKTIDQMLQMQVTQQPQLAAFKDVMTTFLRKHVSFAALKDDMVKLYRDAFTEEEIRAMSAFYRTPVGQKAVEQLPALSAAGAQMGMSRVQANMGELQQAIQKRQQELLQQQQ
jgi:hypothetical protein